MTRKMTYQYNLLIFCLVMIFSISMTVVNGEMNSNPIDLEKVNLGIPKEGTILFLDANLNYIILGYAEDRIDFFDHNYNYMFSFVFETYMRYSVYLDNSTVNIVHNADPYIYKYNFSGQYLETIVDADLADELRDNNFSRISVQVNGNTYNLVTKLTKQELVIESRNSSQTVLTIESRRFFNSLLTIGISHIGGILLLVIIAVVFMRVIKKVNAASKKPNKEEEFEKDIL